VNLMASRKMNTNSGRSSNRTQDKAQPSNSQTLEETFEVMMRNMERMMEIMALGNMPNPREHVDGPPKNPRRPAIKIIKEIKGNNK
jgi:hypothetical protein